VSHLQTLALQIQQPDERGQIISLYIYITAERPGDSGWQLIGPMSLHPTRKVDFPPVVVDGGWPDLAEILIDKTKDFGIPSDASSELSAFYETYLKTKSWRVGWAMYSTLKQIPIRKGVKFASLFSKISNRDSLRLIYWWG
jgi:hypothetical protein